MLTVIFGAGASFDSVATDLAESHESYMVRRPPLATQLFDDRPAHIDAMNKYPAMAPLVGELRQAAAAGGAAMEQELRKMQVAAEEFTPLKRSLLAMRYYLRAVCGKPVTEWRDDVGGVTNYGGLVRQLGEWAHRRGEPLTFITFNYDTLLESAVTAVFGRGFDHLDTYVEDEMCVLLKPHGSVNWFEYVQIDGEGRAAVYGGLDHNQGGSMIKKAQEIKPTGEYIHRRQLQRQMFAIPAIAIPVDQTKTFVCPQAHLEVLRQRLAETDRVLIVGWRASEVHFLKELADHCKAERLAVVDTSSTAAAAVRTNLYDAGCSLGRANGASFNRFSEFVRTRMAANWLDGRALSGDFHAFSGR